jgi:hypothetical protein
MGDKWVIQVSIIAAYFDETTGEMGINFLLHEKALYCESS